MATYSPWDDPLEDVRDPLATAQAGLQPGATIGVNAASGVPSAGATRETPTQSDTGETPPAAATTARPWGWDQIQSAYNQYLGRTASEQEMQAQIGPGVGQPGVNTIIRGIQGSKEAHGYSGVSAYETAVKALEAETDATARAAKHDELARKLYSDLKTYGHDVSWEGDTLMVDGRAYTVGGQTTASPWEAAPSDNNWQGWFQTNLARPNKLSSAELKALEPSLAKIGVKVLTNSAGVSGKVQLPDGTIVDVIRAAGAGGDDFQWVVGGGEEEGGGTSAFSPWDLESLSRVFGTSPTLPTGATTAEPAPSTWRPTAAPYTPGAIEETPVGTATNQAALNLLANPDVISPEVLEQMKAADRETLAQRAELEDQNLQAFGAATDYQFSPWLQAERAAGKRSRDEAVIKGARDLTISAAEKNAAGKRSAIELGLSTESQNLQRTQLRESVKQAAAASGQTSDQIMSSWLSSELDRATQTWLGKEGITIDWARIAQSDRQFKEDLLLRLMALKQADDQFAANYGLNLTQLQLQADQQAYNQYWNAWA